MLGGHSDVKTDAEGLTQMAGYKGAVEAKAETTYDTFEVLHYTSQVVAGTIYQIKVKVGESDYIDAKVLLPLPHTGDAPSAMEVKTGVGADDPFSF